MSALKGVELDRVGEVIEASTTGFVAQCYELYCMPPLGSLVKTGEQAAVLYGVVYYAETTGLEPGRRPIARGKDEATEEGIYRTSPQLAKLLKSEFSALIMGYRQGEKVYQYLSPTPARIHSFVYQCPPEEVREFSKSLGFLNTLLNARLPIPACELIAACVRQSSRAHEDPHRFLVAAGKELAVLMNGRYADLKAVLGRIKE